MEYTGSMHTFAVCAWQDSPYLETCIRSLLAQTVPSRVVLCTSTPGKMVREMAERYALELFVRDGDAGIAADWNFALAAAGTPLVTLAHQDDIYEPDYLRYTLEALNSSDRPLISFTDYYEIRNGEKVYADRSRMLRIKEWMLLPLRKKKCQDQIRIRRRILSFGDPLCCPSVTYVRDHLPLDPFRNGFQSNLDWDCWERISRLSGSFCYIARPLMGHRIHPDSATSKVIRKEESRSGEDLQMLRRFWPAWAAHGINLFYAKAQESNRLEEGGK